MWVCAHSRPPGLLLVDDLGPRPENHPALESLQQKWELATKPFTREIDFFANPILIVMKLLFVGKEKHLLTENFLSQNFVANS